ncbi:MAG: hypothetical protein WCF04_11245 [Candidatus Nanopelagicales bacterium]
MAKGSDKKGDGSSPLSIVDKGHFTHAKCDCGWTGPARRSRKRAREDAAAHLDERCKAFRRK